MIIKQVEVKEDLLSKGCYIYKQKQREDGMCYFLGKHGIEKLVIIFPKANDGDYREYQIRDFTKD